jgi:hypothetical protein
VPVGSTISSDAPSGADGRCGTPRGTAHRRRSPGWTPSSSARPEAGTAPRRAGAAAARDDAGVVLPVYGGGGREVGGPEGHSYSAVLVRSADPGDVRAALREIRFSGWLAPPGNGWTVAVAASRIPTVAAGRRSVAGLAEWLAARLPATTLAVRVLADRQLLLAAWTGDTEHGRYVSDPSRDPGAGDDVLAEPYGVEHAAAIARACDRPDAAGDLAELLAEELDPDSVIESERLARVLRLLGLPTWLVAAPSLPRDIPTGPRARDLTRFGAGVPGLPGRLTGWAVNVVRRRRPPPPVIDPPRGASDMDPWLM